MKILSLKPLTLALAGALILSQGALAAAADTTQANPQAAPRSTLHEEITVGPGRDISPADEAIISSSADKVLNHIAMARDALHKNDPERAKQNMDQAETLLDIIQAALPTTTVTDRIWSTNNKLQYENVGEARPSEVPIYSSLDEREGFDTVKLAAAHAAQTQTANQQKPVANAQKQELVAHDTMLYYEEQDLPLNTVRHFVATAQMALAKHHLMEADQHLLAAQDSVDFVSVYLPEPLVTAKVNLQRAHEHFVAGKIADAKADVGSAITELTRVVQRAGPETKADAQKLLADAQSLQARIDQGGPGLEADLKGLWRHTEALADRAEEYTAVGWSRLRHHGKLRSDLIEAKRFVTDADIDANVAKDPARSNQDLQRAKDYLDKAAAAAAGKPDLEVYVKDAGATVQTLLAGTAKTSPGEMANLESQLGQAITRL
jgi:hypothetical protein